MGGSKKYTVTTRSERKEQVSVFFGLLVTTLKFSQYISLDWTESSKFNSRYSILTEQACHLESPNSCFVVCAGMHTQYSVLRRKFKVSQHGTALPALVKN